MTKKTPKPNLPTAIISTSISFDTNKIIIGHCTNGIFKNRSQFFMQSVIFLINKIQENPLFIEQIKPIEKKNGYTYSTNCKITDDISTKIDIYLSKYEIFKTRSDFGRYAIFLFDKTLKEPLVETSSKLNNGLLIELNKEITDFTQRWKKIDDYKLHTLEAFMKKIEHSLSAHNLPIVNVNVKQHLNSVREDFKMHSNKSQEFIRNNSMTVNS